MTDNYNLSEEQKAKIKAEEDYRAQIRTDGVQKPKKKGIGCLAWFIIIIFIIFSIMVINSFKKTKPDVEVTPEQKKSDFIAFYKSYVQIAKKSDETHSIAITDINNYANGSLNRADLYIELKKARDIQEAYYQAQPSLPDSLSEFNDDFLNVRSNLGDIILNRKNSMDDFANYLNTGDLEKLSKAKERIASENETATDRVAYFSTLAGKLNIKLEDINTSE